MPFDPAALSAPVVTAPAAPSLVDAPAGHRAAPRPDTVADRVDFSGVRYALCWEDADVLLGGLAIRPGHVCLSIASAGDNTLALLTADPARVVAVDLSAAQLACLALRVAAYGTLDHAGLLDLLGVVAVPGRTARAGARARAALYARVRPALDAEARGFWDARPGEIARGAAHAGRFERYLRLFRRAVLPLVHGRATVEFLLAPKSESERAAFYARVWATRRWRGVFRLFFSRALMGRLGRDPELFRHADAALAQTGLADGLLARAEHAATALDPARNPYLRWILTGTYARLDADGMVTGALPLALRPEHFATIRARLGRIEVRRASLEAVLADAPAASFDRFNLSDVFEYVAPYAYELALLEIARVARPGARLAYWNLAAPRSRPDWLASELRPLTREAARLHACDQAFFYRRFVLEERC